MQFLKNHYEKVILSIVLLGLAAGAAFLILKVGQERQYLEDARRSVVRTPPKPFQTLEQKGELAPTLAVVNRMRDQDRTRISGEHNLFNPVEWRRGADGRLIKGQTGEEFGAGGLEVVSIEELYLIISFESVSGTEDRPRYTVSMLRQTDPRPSKVARVLSQASPKIDPFRLLAVHGPATDPVALEVEIAEYRRPFRLVRDEPHVEAIGFAATLRHPHLSLNIPPGRRRGDSIRIEGENYKIVAITRSEVVLSADSTQKRTTLTYDGAP